MILWMLLGLALALLFLADGARLRKRLAALPVLNDAPAASVARDQDGFDVQGPAVALGANGEEFALIVAPGARLSGEARVAAAAHARAEGLQVLDLVPGVWSAVRAIGFAQAVDPVQYRQERLAAGWSACQAILVKRELLRRAGLTDTPPADPLSFVRLARTLKQYAPQGFGFAVSQGLESAPLSASDRYALFREVFLGLTPAVLAGQLALFVLTIACAARGAWLGWLGLLAFHLQPWLALGGGPIEADDLLLVALFAWPVQVWQWFSAIAAAKPDPVREAALARLRPVYDADLSQGLERLFEPRSNSCYVCYGTRLVVQHRVPDRIQHKPGQFVLERCEDCGHIFQNPRLSIAGLEFYYRDFYDGLGGPWLETVFGFSGKEYLARARAITGTAPRRWLDVGGGYGHFCLAAREVWPKARFECLDMSNSVDEAVRRGWADAGYRGLFPELAPSLAGQFDVVSLSHCLEHTRDPRAELAAAKQVLVPGGAIVIEVPDPESKLRRPLGGWWLPYFQPQHQHLLSVSNMKRLLEEAGFELARVERGEAHVGQDFFFAAFMALDTLAPQPSPWRPVSRYTEWRHNAVWAVGTPALLLGAAMDAVVRRLVSGPGVSNAYRVVGRLTGAADASSAEAGASRS